jgi:DNA polymerase III subunit delta'
MALRDVIGQDRVIRILLKTLERGRFPSSYLFAGESGIGKKLTAINLAKVLNCPGVKGHDRQYDCCDTCPSCRKIDSYMHPDFRLLSPENGQIRIEEIREIDESLSFKAFEGEYKTVIIDDAEAMNQFAANALLKTLEEPPAYSLIILISSNPERLPDTIRSRCSRINFTLLPPEACEEVIRRGTGHRPGEGVKKQGDAAPATARGSHLETLVRLSMGKPGNALSEDLIEQRTRFLALLKDMVHMMKDSWASREEMEKWFDLMLILLRDMAVLKITRDEKYLVNSDIKEYISQMSDATEIQGIIEQYQRLSALRSHIHFNLNKSLTWNYTGFLLRGNMGGLYA